MGKIQRLPRFILQKKISFENQGKCIQKLYEISDALWKRDMVPKAEKDRDFAKNRNSHDEKYMLSEIK